MLELQNKLGALQAAYEALQHDYGTVTEQLAARQAEVTLARLSPESTALKQQVGGGRSMLSEAGRLGGSCRLTEAPQHNKCSLAGCRLWSARAYP